jgi:KDO2-lipid IV(A) lauroyltransferase
MSRNRKTTFQHRLEYGAARAVQAVICALPAGAARAVGGSLGSFAFMVLKLRRDVAMGNLERVFGDRFDRDERLEIARESYRNFGRMTFEYARFPRLTQRDIERLITVTGGEHLDAALAGGKGAILVAGHFGNWEILATLARLGYPMTFLVGEQHNILVDGLMNRLRARFGGEIVPVTGNLMGVLRALRRNRIVAMLSDQDAGKNGVFVDFLGKPASTPYGPGRMAAGTGAALLPAFVVRRAAGAHEVVVGEAVARPLEDLPLDERVRIFTQGYTKEFEASIRLYPDHYFWMHRRWKTSPPQGDGSVSHGQEHGTQDGRSRRTGGEQ